MRPLTMEELTVFLLLLFVLFVLHVNVGHDR